MKPIVATAAAVLVLGTIAASSFGGWATVSVVDPPEHLVIGEPQRFDFQVRAHGAEPLANLNPQVQARSGSRSVSASASGTGTRGTYRAVLTIPKAGDWTVHVKSGFGTSSGQLLPIAAIASGERPAPLTDYERGRRLFAAKGCVSCHVHSDVDVDGQMKNFGPELSKARFPAEYLARFLADPSIKMPATVARVMPKQSLNSREISALVSFINATTQVTTR